MSCQNRGSDSELSYAYLMYSSSETTGEDRSCNSIWSPTARLDASMGSKFGPNGSGTFGGYVELRNQKDEWKKFRLTCYHVAQPELKSESLGNIGENDPDYLDRASRLRREELFGRALTVYIMENKEINRLSKLMLTSQTYWDSGNALLGEVYAASGYRTRAAADHRAKVHMDWALIEVSSDRLGNNTIDTEGPPKFNLPNETIQASRDPVDEMRVFKLGRTIGWTQGCYSNLESAHLEAADGEGNEQVETMEHLVTGVGGEPFSMEGDSGAFIFDRALALVGMLFSSHNNRKVTYMTSCKDLLADIMEVAGATDIRVPV